MNSKKTLSQTASELIRRRLAAKVIDEIQAEEEARTIEEIRHHIIRELATAPVKDIHAYIKKFNSIR